MVVDAMIQVFTLPREPGSSITNVKGGAVQGAMNRSSTLPHASKLMYHDPFSSNTKWGAHSVWTFEFLPRGRGEFHASEQDSTEAIENPF